MCNAHNHSPGCTCGWGGESTFVTDSNEAFTTLFGSITSTRPKKKVVKEDMSSSKPLFHELFDKIDN